MPLIVLMLLLIFENLRAYAFIQDYAFIRTLRVMNKGKYSCKQSFLPTSGQLHIFSKIGLSV